MLQGVGILKNCLNRVRCAINADIKSSLCSECLD